MDDLRKADLDWGRANESKGKAPDPIVGPWGDPTTTPDGWLSWLKSRLELDPPQLLSSDIINSTTNVLGQPTCWPQHEWAPSTQFTTGPANIIHILPLWLPSSFKAQGFALSIIGNPTATGTVKGAIWDATTLALKYQAPSTDFVAPLTRRLRKINFTGAPVTIPAGNYYMGLQIASVGAGVVGTDFDEMDNAFCYQVSQTIATAFPNPLVLAEHGTGSSAGLVPLFRLISPDYVLF